MMGENIEHILISLYLPCTKFRSLCLSVWLPRRLSVCPSVCAYSCPAHSLFCFLVWHWLIIFGTWVYNHERLCRTHSWSWYDVHLWPQGLYSFFFYMFPIIVLCLKLAYHIWHMCVSPWDDVSRIFMIPIRRWPLTSRSLQGCWHFFVSGP